MESKFATVLIIVALIGLWMVTIFHQMFEYVVALLLFIILVGILDISVSLE